MKKIDKPRIETFVPVTRAALEAVTGGNYLDHANASWFAPDGLASRWNGAPKF